MTTLKFNINLTNDCNLSLLDVTGFITDNTTGFIPEDYPDIPSDSYRLSDGYFIDAITYNKYNCDPTIVLQSGLMHIMSADVDITYSKNFAAEVYKLSQDSLYTVYRMFIMNEAFYSSEKDTGRFTNKVVYYSNGTEIFKASGDTVVPISLGTLISADRTNSTVLVATNTFASTCYLNMCYYTLMQTIISEGPSCSDTSLIRYRDFLYMSIETIQYLQELGNITEIQRVLEGLDICGGICKSIVSTNSNCGCNG